MSRSKATEQFLKFHAENPHVYYVLVRLAREALEMWGAVGINAILERARWEPGLQTTGEPFKLNENHAAFYSRLIMHLNPDLAGVFTLRQSVADDPGYHSDPDQAVLWEEAHSDDSWLGEAARAVEDST